MKILDIRTIAGPNVYHHRPVLIVNVDLENLTERSSQDIAGFNERLIALMPGLRNHRCSPRYSGGFIERLKRGTYFAHILEHIGLELSVLAGIGVSYGKSLYGGAPGIYKIIVRCKNEEGMKYLMKKALEIAHAVVTKNDFDLTACIVEAKAIIQETRFGPSTQALIDAANQRNIPWRILNDQHFIQLGYGKYRKFLDGTTSSSTSDIAVAIAQDKNLTKKILDEASIRVPRGRAVFSLAEAFLVQAELAAPVAVKPVNGNHGRGVSINVKTEDEMKLAFLTAQKHSKIVMIEESLKGLDFRVLVVGGKMIAVAERSPAHVMGDGIHSLNELIEEENKNPQRGIGHENVLTRISVDQETLGILQRKNLTLDYVPAAEEKFFLKDTANLSTGGIAIDRTEDVHPEIKEMCERAARVIDLDICGIDLMARDIGKPILESECAIIEVNAGPGIRMHHHPSYGVARDVAGAILDHLYPEHSNGRIPIVSVTGTNGKTTVARMIGHIVSLNGKSVGLTTTDGIFLNNKKMASGDTTGPISTRTVLSDPLVEVAVLEIARGGLVKRGLGYDWSDVGIFTNLAPDHIGQDGIETLDDILHIKSLVIERVKSGGNVILNADSKEIVSLVSEARSEMHTKKLTYFSLHPDNPVVLNHLRHGGHAYYLSNGEIIEAQGVYESTVIDLEEIPLTLGGTSDFHAANVMAVIAGAHALEISDDIIMQGLLSFDQDKNLGRTNLYKVGPGFLLLDYGHNADAFVSVAQMCRKWNIQKLTAVVTCPGDRSDELIEQLGSTAARAFDKIIIREDRDLRGRGPGVVSNMIREAIHKTNPKRETQVVLHSVDALKAAVSEMNEQELVIYFYEDLSEIENHLLELNAEKWQDPSLFNRDSNERRGPGARKKRGDEWLQYSF